MDLKKLGLFIAEEREKSGFKSQRQLAIASKISNGSIARIESGKQKPSPETIAGLSKHLKSTSYEELMQKAGYLDEIEHTEKESSDVFILDVGDFELTDDEITRKYAVKVDGEPLKPNQLKALIELVRAWRKV